MKLTICFDFFFLKKTTSHIVIAEFNDFIAPQYHAVLVLTSILLHAATMSGAIKEPDNDPTFEQLVYKMYIEWKIAKHVLSYFITSAAQDIDNCCFQVYRNKLDQIKFFTFPACLENLSKR